MTAKVIVYLGQILITYILKVSTYTVHVVYFIDKVHVLNEVARVEWNNLITADKLRLTNVSWRAKVDESFMALVWYGCLLKLRNIPHKPPPTSPVIRLGSVYRVSRVIYSLSISTLPQKDTEPWYTDLGKPVVVGLY